MFVPLIATYGTRYWGKPIHQERMHICGTIRSYETPFGLKHTYHTHKTTHTLKFHQQIRKRMSKV